MSAEVLEQSVLGSRRLSNYLVAAAVSIGGVGFLLASLSSYLGRDLLPLGHPAALIFVPQGLVMGLYSVAAALLAAYLWYVIAVDVGGGSNRFDKDAGVVTISRRGFRQPVTVEIPLKDVKAVKVEVRDGFNARRRVALRIQGRRDMPLTRVGEPFPLPARAGRCRIGPVPRCESRRPLNSDATFFPLVPAAVASPGG